MSHPVVVRVAKLANWGAIAASGQHTWRERDTPNADSERTHLNEDWRPVGSAAELRDAVSQRLQTVTEKATSRYPVMCLEYLVTANREAFREGGGQVDSGAYFRDALAWIEKKHGAANVVAVNVQRDEAAPHLVVYVVPLVEREASERKRSVIVGKNPDGSQRRETITVQQEAGVRLSAAAFVDGRAKLSQLQTDFAQEVGAAHGLRRGIEGSKARHATVREWYAQMGQEVPKIPGIDVPKAGLIEGREAYGQRVAQSVLEQIQPERAALLARAATADVDRKASRDAAATAAALQERTRPVLEAFRGLTKDEQKKLLKAITSASRQMKDARQAKVQSTDRAAPSRGEKGQER